MKLFISVNTINDAYMEFGRKIVNILSPIDCTSDKRYLYRICELYVNEGVDKKILLSAFNERCAIVDYLSEDDISRKDIYDIANENVKGSFRKRWYSTNEQLTDFKNTIIYEDSATTINKPTCFSESQNIGNSIWCFCFKQDKWIQHNSIEKETIYFIHNTLVPKQWEYNAVCVRVNGDILVLDGTHNYLSRKNGELDYYLKQIGGIEYLVSDKNNNESKNRKNMKQNKKTITEAQLRNIVAESVKRILKESSVVTRGTKTNVCYRPVEVYETENDRAEKFIDGMCDRIDYALKKAGVSCLVDAFQDVQQEDEKYITAHFIINLYNVDTNDIDKYYSIVSKLFKHWDKVCRYTYSPYIDYKTSRILIQVGVEPDKNGSYQIPRKPYYYLDNTKHIANSHYRNEKTNH